MYLYNQPLSSAWPVVFLAVGGAKNEEMGSCPFFFGAAGSVWLIWQG
jgi:hypothetical protein